MKVHVIGCGSAGMHFIRAASLVNAEQISVSDTSAEMIKTLNDRYKARYNTPCPVVYGEHKADVTIIATPPDTHLAMARQAQSEHIIIEKPICSPGQFDQLKKADFGSRKVWVNYQYVLHPAIKWLRDNLPVINSPMTAQVFWQEHSDFCAKAHPWKNDSWYLFDSKRGGGAACEHSHGLAVFVQCLAASGQGTLQTVGHKLMKDGHDVFSQFDCVTSDDQGNLLVMGTVIQDFLSRSPTKVLKLACDDVTAVVDFRSGFCEIYYPDGTERVKDLCISREDEFTLILKHIQEADYDTSPVAMKNLLSVQEILSNHFKEEGHGRVN